MQTRRQVGYMSQAFSLYSELTVSQNLNLHAHLFQLPPEAIPGRVKEMAKRFDLSGVIMLCRRFATRRPSALSMAVAMIDSPQMLILDEPTSGVIQSHATRSGKSSWISPGKTMSPSSFQHIS